MTNTELFFIISSCVVCFAFIVAMIIYYAELKFASNHKELLTFILFACSAYLFFSGLTVGYVRYTSGLHYAIYVVDVVIWLINSIL